MPYVMRKLPNKDLYTVKNAQTKKVHSYGSTKAAAEAQVRLLDAVGGCPGAKCGCPKKKSAKKSK